MGGILIPPKGYSKRNLDTITIKKNTPFYRCYSSHRSLSDSIYFGLGEYSRFNDLEQKIGVMYIGDSIEASLAETIMHNAMSLEYISIEKLNSFSLVEIVFNHDIELVNFNAAGLKKNNVNSSIFTCEHSISRSWATAIIKNENNYHGIYYPCNHDNQFYSIALFNRSDLDYSVVDLGRLYDDVLSDFLDDFLLEHNIAID